MSKKKRKKTTDDILDVSMGMDDRFAFIAGYTPGGFSYGTTWEELGIDPELPMEEKERLYNQIGIADTPVDPPCAIDDSDLPF